MLIGLKYAKLIILQNLALNKGTWSRFALMLFKLREIWFGKLILRKIHVVVVVVVVLLYGLVCTRLQHSKNIQSCIASQWKSNTDNKTLLLLKWNLHNIIHGKYKTHCENISSKVCGCYMARLTLSKNSNSASLTILLYRLFTLLSTDGDNNNASVKSISLSLTELTIIRIQWTKLLSIHLMLYNRKL